MIEATKTAVVEPNSSSWTGIAKVEPQPNGPVKYVPIQPVAAGNKEVNRTVFETRYGKAFVISGALPSGTWTVLPLVESNGPIVTVPVGTEPYTEGVVVLFV